MLRLHFTAEDLLHVRFASDPAPLMQLVLALATLQRRDVLFDRWRRDAVGALPHAAWPLLDLVPATGTGPEFLDSLSNSAEDGIAQILDRPAAAVRAELRSRVVPPSGTPSAWIAGLAARDAASWRQLGGALCAAHQNLIAPAWTSIRASFHAEVALRARMIAQSGLKQALCTLHPGSVWSGSTLHIRTSAHLDVHLSGRGVTLLASPVWAGRPLIADHPDGSLLVVYAAAVPLPLVTTPDPDRSLAHLIGHTRADALRLTTVPRTTSELARALEVSVATASEHAKVLREAGLTSTTRAGKAVLHQISPLGEALLTPHPATRR